MTIVLNAHLANWLFSKRFTHQNVFSPQHDHSDVHSWQHLFKEKDTEAHKY